MEPYLVKTGLACKLVGVDHIRFNAAVAEGVYPCAPSLAEGNARLFDERDLVTLRFYGVLVRQKVHPRVAGRLCCELKAALPADTGAKLPDPSDEPFVFVVVDKFGNVGALPGSQFKPESMPDLDAFFGVPVKTYRTEIRAALSQRKKVFADD